MSPPTTRWRECNYEDHPARWDKASFRYDDYDQRKGAYWSLFAGGFGFTYGCGDIFMFYREPKDWEIYGHFYPILPWQHALYLPGARQMVHVKSLMLSRPFLTRIPDQGLLWSAYGRGGERVQATRDESGSYAFVYCVTGRPVTVDLAKLSGQKITAWWYDPRVGAAFKIGEFAQGAKTEFTPPSSGYGHDWVLVLDDAAKGYPPPGK
jgi:hypothetical protein